MQEIATGIGDALMDGRDSRLLLLSVGGELDLPGHAALGFGQLLLHCPEAAPS